MLSRVFLSLGSNAGDRMRYMDEALGQLGSCGRLERVSSVYETEPWGETAQDHFLNCAAGFETSLAPLDLLNKIRNIEIRLARQRPYKWAPRTIDIDILLFDNLIVNEPELRIPHPLMQDRRFVLVPLSEIAGDSEHPVLKKTIKELEAICADESRVLLFGKLPYGKL